MVKSAYWTPSSWECFKNNCICSEKCSNYETCQHIASQTKDKQPPIKKVVLDLIDGDISIPIAVTDYKLNVLSNNAVVILRMWLLDNLTIEEIMAKTGQTRRGVIESLTLCVNRFECSYDYTCKQRKAKEFRKWALENLAEEIIEVEKQGYLRQTILK